MDYFKVRDWVCVGRGPSTNILQNQHTAELTQEFLFDLYSQDVLEKILSLSFLNHPQITKLLHFEKFTNYDPTSYTFSHFSVRLFSQFVELRLSQILNLPENHLFQLIFETLLGFQIIYQNYRPVRATPSSIGFNKKSQLKIVLSQVLMRQQSDISLSEESIVQSIFECFKQFGSSVRVPPSMNFTEAIYYIGHRISAQRNKFSVGQLPRKSMRLQSLNGPRVRTERHSINQNYRQTQIQFNNNNQRSIPSRDNHLYTQNTMETSKQYRRGQMSQVSPHIKSSVQINIEQARTTQNNLSVLADIIDIDHNHLPLEILDEKKPQYIKLNILDRVLSDQTADQELKKICRLFKYALIDDPLIYSELKRVKGKIDDIQNPLIRKKIQEIMDSKQKYEGLTTRIPNLVFSTNKRATEAHTQRQERIKQIIKNQKLKIQIETNRLVSRNSAMDGLRNPNSLQFRIKKQREEVSPIMRNGDRLKKMNQFKEQASRVLFDF